MYDEKTTAKKKWTYTLMANIEQWMWRKHGEVNFCPRQALTGNKNFASYFCRFNLRANKTCDLCQNMSDDNAKHTVFRLPESGILEHIYAFQISESIVHPVLPTSGYADGQREMKETRQLFLRHTSPQEGDIRTSNLMRRRRR